MMVHPQVYADFHNADKDGRLRLNCNGTIEDLTKLGISLSEGLELRLCMEDVEAIGKVTYSQDEDVWVAIVDWNAINDEKAFPSRLPDNAIVVRGGKHDPIIISRSTAQHPCGVKGISVVSAAGKSIEELSATVPHSEITTTTVGAVRRSGGDVVPTKGKSPYHATLLIDDTELPENTSTSNPNAKDGVPCVFADFNNTTECGRVRLNTNGAISDMQSHNVNLHAGLEISLYDLDEYVVVGKVVNHETEGWVAEVDWTKLTSSFH